MTEQCVFCGNNHLDNKLTRYIYQKNEQLLVVESVPCLECTFCGEQYFAAVVLQKIENDFQDIVNQKKKPERIMQVAVENFAAFPV